MAKAKSHVPEGLPAVVPQLVVKDAKSLIDFAVKAFQAVPGHTMPGPEGKGIMHGMFQIGGSAVFVSDVFGMAQPTSANLFVYVPDVDAAVKAAEAHGAKVVTPPSDMFWGDRWAMVVDPQGQTWQVATHKEVISPDEMMKRMAANMPAK
ncbi:MAG: VOC family protein [Kofleriaceae bacterium]